MPPGSHGPTEPGPRRSGPCPPGRTGPAPPRPAGGRARTSRCAGSRCCRPVTVSRQRAAPHGVGDPDGHARAGGEVAQVGLEQAGAGAQVAGLEQRHHHGQQRERPHVVVGPGDEGEHLELALDGGAVVGQHVHPVVLGQQRRGRSRAAREGEAAGPVQLATRRRPSVPSGRSPSAAHRGRQRRVVDATAPRPPASSVEVWSVPASSAVQSEVYPLRSKSMAARPRLPVANSRATEIIPSSAHRTRRANRSTRSTTSRGTGWRTRT